MALNVFKWDEDFNTGNALIDSQHFTLVEMINELLELSVNNKSIQLDTISTISKKLSKYVKVHFSSEEEIMKSHCIDQRHINEQIQSHNEFIADISKRFQDLSELQNPEKIVDTVEYLIRWLAYHILSIDKSLVRQMNYINSNGLSPTEAYDIEQKMTDSTTEPLLKALKVLYLLVSKKNVEIKRKNIELEEKVKQRTAELLEANEQLNALLFKDTLTNLPNLKFVMEETQKLIFNWERYKVPFSILFIDVDKFKSVNDNFGHASGDQILKWIATFLKSNIRVTDIACRLSGDEFIVICSNTDLDGAMVIGQKLNRECKNKSKQVLDFWDPSLSIGIAMIDDTIKTPTELIKIADSAMYISKNKGGSLTSVLSS